MGDIRIIKHNYVLAVQNKKVWRAITIAMSRKNEFRALVIAINNNNVELGKMLLELGWDKNEVQERDGCTPLHAAINMRSSEMVAALLDGGADIHKEDLFGYSPIARCVRIRMNEKAIEVYYTLASRMQEAEFRGNNQRGETLLHCMGRNTSVPYGLFREMMQRGVGVNERDTFTGRNFLMDMMIFYSDQYMELELNNADFYGNTIMHRMASEERVVLLRWAVQLPQIGIGLANVHGQTPIWIAAKRGNVEVFKMLYSMGENVEGEAVEYAGSVLRRSIADIAITKGHVKIAAMIQNEVNAGQGVESLYRMARKTIRKQLAKDGRNIATKVGQLGLPKVMEKCLVTIE